MIMKKFMFLLIVVFLCLVTHRGFAEEDKELLKNLDTRIKNLEKSQDEQDILGKLKDKVSFAGTINLDFSYANDSDITDNTVNDPTSDLQIGEVELGAEIKLHEYVTAILILEAENLDSDDRVFWDQATMNIKKDGFPLYFVGGKRSQPFGVFENHLINDPITQVCYETNKTGVTLGFAPDFLGLDASFTLYRGEVLADKLYNAGFGLERSTSATYSETDDVNSYIGNITLSPLKGMNLAVFYNSEPGDGSRNETIGASLTYQIWNITLDAEYMTALEREQNNAAGTKYKESAWFCAVAFQARDSLELAVRYEGFNDDRDGDQDGTLTDRYSIGANYTIFEKNNFTTTLMAEYRRSNYEMTPGSSYDDKVDEFFVRLALAF